MKVYLFNYALLYDNIKTDLIRRGMQEKGMDERKNMSKEA